MFFNKKGIIQPLKQWKYEVDKSRNYFLNFWEGSYIRSYLTDLIHQLFSSIPMYDITGIIKDKALLKEAAQEGSFIVAQLPFYFRESVENDGIREGRYIRSDVTINFTYDPWYSVSSSAWACWMSGQQRITIIGKVRSVIENEGVLCINILCYSAGAFFGSHPERVAHKFNVSDSIGNAE